MRRGSVDVAQDRVSQPTFVASQPARARSPADAQIRDSG
jgi:hypothetical protein